MTIADDFKEFCDAIRLQDSEMRTSAEKIAKKLNKEYYDLDGETEEHMFIVGSVGRNTAVKGSSDLDLLFELPNDVYSKYNAYNGNGQSALLQDMKKVLKERYPKTDIRGDGQVIVIEFSKYTVELVPGFRQGDDSFKYPDTNNGGSWKKTDPLKEQKACQTADDDSDEKYFDFCHIVRAWKNKQGFQFGGLLIDTLVYNFFDDEEYFEDKGYEDYLEILQGLFDYLKSRDKDQEYWFAPGSNQQVKNKGKGRFVNEAKKAAKKLNDVIEDMGDINECLRELLGSDFPKTEKTSEEKKAFRSRKQVTSTEEFIEDLFSVDIRYSLQLECKVSQDGFRDDYLRNMLRDRRILRVNKKLDFFIETSDFPETADIYWKVRNVGREAEKRKCIRGEIKKTNSRHQVEHTSFRGAHYVECYAVKSGVCIARGHIDVPISTI